jgi:cation diffusion facilitator family transporter
VLVPAGQGLRLQRRMAPRSRPDYPQPVTSTSLRRFALLSVATAVATIGIKTVAYLMTGSVGLLSDAIESVVNLAAAVVALVMIALAEKPADEEHAYGHSKAEYFSSAVEGGLIVLAAASIAWTATPRLLRPQPLENLGSGLVISTGASLLNLAVARVLLAAGRRHNSITLEADGEHLMTDVWTSAGVLAGVLLVKLAGWLWLDSAVALAVAVNILRVGYQLMLRSAQGLLDTAIPAAKREEIAALLARHEASGLRFHSVLTRQAGRRSFVALHVLVPGSWSVLQGHDFLEQLEGEIRALFTGPATVFTHLEPVEDPTSMHDIGLDRKT